MGAFVHVQSSLITIELPCLSNLREALGILKGNWRKRFLTSIDYLGTFMVVTPLAPDDNEKETHGACRPLNRCPFFKLEA